MSEERQLQKMTESASFSRLAGPAHDTTRGESRRAGEERK